MNRFRASILSALTMLGANMCAQPAASQPTVKALISRASDGTYTYEYRLSNSSATAYWTLDIDLKQPAGGAAASDISGLPLHPSYLSDIAQTVRRNPSALAMVAATAEAPVGWAVSPSTEGFMVWASDDLLPPAASVTGLRIFSKGLPGVRTYYARPYIDIDNLKIAPPVGGPEDASRYERELKEIENRASTTGSTIGPTLPPAAFDPTAFVLLLLSHAEKAYELRWIDRGVYISVVAKLEQVKRALAAQQIVTAKNVVGALVNEVAAQDDKHISAEAAALVGENARYLLAQL